MSNDVKEKLLGELDELFRATDQALTEWKGEGNLQFPVLLGLLAANLNWDDKQLRKADPFVREYVRSHPDWHVTRGAHGGIMRASEKQKKEAAKTAKEQATKQMKAAIEAKAAASQAVKAAAIVAVETETETETETEIEAETDSATESE